MNMWKKKHGALRRLFSLGVKTLITVSLFVCYCLTIFSLSVSLFFLFPSETILRLGQHYIIYLWEFET